MKICGIALEDFQALPPRAFKLLSYLLTEAHHAGEEEENDEARRFDLFEPSLTEMSEKTGMSQKQVRGALADLMAGRYLKKTGWGKYRLTYG